MSFSAFNPGTYKRVAAGVAIASVGAVGVAWWQHSSPSGNTPPVTADYFVAASGSDSNLGTSAGSPFLTFDKCARQATSSAKTCQVAGGTYPEQVMGGENRTVLMTFVPATGATIRFTQGTTTCSGFTDCVLILPTGANFLKFSGSETRSDIWANSRIGFDFNGRIITGDPSTGTDPSHDVTFDKVNTAGQVSLRGYNMTFSNSNIGANTVDEDLMQIQHVGTSTASHDITITGNVFHDLSTAAGHDDCIQVLGWQTYAITNNVFFNCNSTDVFAAMHDNQNNTESGVGLRLEGNLFYPNLTAAGVDTAIVTIGGDAGDATQACSGGIFAYNTVVGAKTISLGCPNGSGTITAANILSYANVLPFIASGTCAGATWSHNWLSDSAQPTAGNSLCSGGATAATKAIALNFVSPGTCTIQTTCSPAPPISWVPASGSDVLAAGATAPALATDLLGITRPSGGASSDAGSFEGSTG